MPFYVGLFGLILLPSFPFFIFFLPLFALVIFLISRKRIRAFESIFYNSNATPLILIRFLGSPSCISGMTSMSTKDRDRFLFCKAQYCILWHKYHSFNDIWPAVFLS